MEHDRRTALGWVAGAGIASTVVVSACARKDDDENEEGNATIDRTAFGIGSGAAAEALGKTVALSFSFDARAKGP